MGKIKYALLIIAFFLTTLAAQAQITLEQVDAGPYTPGSSIAAIFSTAGSACIQKGNTFNLYLIYPNGTEVPIGSYAGFYSTFVNGQIPANTPAGTGYKLQVRSSAPVQSSASSIPFEIKTGPAVEAKISSSLFTISNNPVTFGACSSDEGTTTKTFRFTNESTSGSSVTANLKNELTPGTPAVLTFTPADATQSYTADQAHYTIFVRAKMPDNTIATRAYFLINNLAVTAFTTASGNTVCYPTGSFEYRVDVSSPDGIRLNFPGNTYKIDWGDGTSDEYSLCDIQNSNNRVRHSFSKSSCGLQYTSGNTTVYNAFGINVGVQSPFCGPIGTPISTSARVVTRPENEFTFPPVACLNDQITLVNHSTAGQKANAGSLGCTPNHVLYNWYVDGILVAADKEIDYNFVHKFTTKGIHKVRLSSSSDGTCQADDVEHSICVQDPPKPAFTLSSNLICLTTGTLIPVNTSVLDNTCPSTPVYTWTVLPADGVTYLGGTSAGSKDPQFKFIKSGIYTITLGIKTATCEVVTTAQEVVVNDEPQLSLSPDITLCARGNYTFDPNGTVTKTTISGTAKELPGTYSWTVTGGAYSFVAPSTASSKYPTINFADYATYTITATHTNNCNTIVKTQKITFSESPVATITANPDPVCYDGTVNLQGDITNSTGTTFSWSSEGGGVFSNPAILNPVYTPSTAERDAGKATVKLVVQTGLQGACAVITGSKDLIIRPKNLGTDTTEIICSGNKFDYTPKSSIPGSTFTWTAVNADGHAGPFTAAGTGNISGIISNTSTTANALIVYTITPSSNGCTGLPYKLSLTITPKASGSATAGKLVICSSQASDITLSANITGTRFTWTSTVTGNITGNTQQTTPVLISSIQDILVNAGNTQGSVTYTFTPYSEGLCPGTAFPITIKVDPPTTVASAGPDQILCAQTKTGLKGNVPATGETGLWTKVSGTGNIVIQSPASPETEVTGLLPGQSYVFKWTIKGNSACGPTESTVNIQNNSEVNQHISSSQNVVCNGQTLNITGSLPTGGDGTNYEYVWEQKEGAGAWTVVPGETGKDLSIKLTSTGTVTIRRTVKSGGCSAPSNELQITVQAPITSNSILKDQAICSGKLPEILRGSLPQGADGSGNFLYQWQSSADGNNWTNIATALAKDYQPQSLTETTFFRRLAGTLQCSGSFQSTSNVVKITVYPNAKAEFTWTSDKGCIPFKVDIQAVPYADRNKTYTWYANDVQIGTGITFPEYIIKTEKTNVTIKLVVTSLNGCSDDSEFSHLFSTEEVVAASFIPVKSEGCDPLKITFVNTSVLTAGATFKWDFGNGETSVRANPDPVTFYADPSGKDTLYTVTLIATTSCGPSTVSTTVFVKAKPIPVFTPSKTTGCSPMTVDFINTSPGGSNKYIYDFGDGSQPVERTDKSPVQHIYNTNKVETFVATMTAINDCGVPVKKSYNIIVSPRNLIPLLVVDPKEQQGCAPLTVRFDNNSAGGTKFKFEFGDGTDPMYTLKTGTETHTFSKAGTYTVKMTAYNTCSEDFTTQTITVLPQPVPDFDADITMGCPGTTVQFQNNTQDGLIYAWDFGDGSPISKERAPKHTYDGKQEYYTVTLTATNSLECTNIVSKNQFIHIVPLPMANFSVSPSTVINIPDYTFRFEDESTNNPVKWEWTFGDKENGTSNLRNPSYTYADTGKYIVTLRVYNQQGCTTSTFKQVRIEGVPGYLYLPNAFTPGGARQELRVFKAKGSGIKSWRMTVFNKWGQALWETTRLDDGRPVDGWDGTFNSSPVPQGIYFWKVDVEFINGTSWKGMSFDSSPPKRTGPIHLIR